MAGGSKSYAIGAPSAAPSAKAADAPKPKATGWLRSEPRTALVVAFTVMVALAAAVLLQLRRDHRIALERAEIRLVDLAWSSSAGVRDAFDRTRRLLELAVRATRDGSQDSAAALATLQRLDPAIVNILIVGPDGMLRASKTGLPAFPKFFTNQPFYERMVEGGDRLYVGPFADAQLGSSPLALAVAIEGEGGRFDGAAIAIVDAERLAARIGTISPGVSVLVADSGGRIMAGFRDGRPIPADAWGAGVAGPAAATDGAPVVERVSGPDGDQLVARASVATYPASVAIAQAAVEPLSSWFDSLWIYAVVFAAPCIAAGILAAALTRIDRRAETAKAGRERAEARFSAATRAGRVGLVEFESPAGSAWLTPSLARLLGLGESPAKLNGEAWRDIVHPDDRMAMRDALESVRRTGHGSGATLRLAHADGRWIWARFVAQPGANQRIVGVVTDVDAEKGAEAKRREVERLLRESIENAPQGVALWDADGALVISNRRFAEFVGADRAAIRPGMKLEDVTRLLLAPGEEPGPDGRPTRWQSRDLGGFADGSDELLLVEGRWLHAARRITSDGGELTVMTDVTAIKNQEAELLRSQIDLKAAVATLERSQDMLERQAQELTSLTARLELEKTRAEDASRAKTEFLANMSHELRTPLNAIIGFSEIMRSELFGPLGHPKYVGYAKDVVESGQGLLELITDILDMSKIENGELRLEPEPIDAGEAAAETLRLIEARAAERGVRLLRDVPQGLTAYADRRAIKRILLNLLSNAIKFTESGGAARLRLRPHGAYLVFSVEDTGCGIDPADIPKLGQPFVQLRREPGEKPAGTGLGLAVAKALVGLQGGGLSIESARGKGTVVRFTVPMRDPDAEAGSPAELTAS